MKFNRKYIYRAVLILGATSLIEAGIDINHKNHYGDTALLIVSRQGYLNLVKLLIEKGTNPSLRNKNKENARKLAEINKHKAVLNFLDKAAPTSKWLEKLF